MLKRMKECINSGIKTGTDAEQLKTKLNLDTPNSALNQQMAYRKCSHQSRLHLFIVTPRERRGVLNKFLYGEAPPRGPTPYPVLHTIFHEKGGPFVYLLLTNRNFASLLTAVNALPFK